MNLNGPPDAASAPTDTEHGLRLRLPRDKAVAGELVLVNHVHGMETLCGGVAYEVSCVSTRTDLSRHLTGLPVELQFVIGNGARHSVCGIIEAVVAGEADGALATYQLRLRDALAFMDQDRHSRVFRDCTEIDITIEILDQWRLRNPLLGRAFDYILWNLKTTSSPRDITEQHDESDAAFLRRLWQRRGLAWFFEAGRAGTGDTPAHTLVLFDDPDALQQNAAGAVRYRHDDDAGACDVITAWHAVLRGSPLSRGDEIEYFQGRSGVRDLCIGQWISVSGHAGIDAHPEAAREFVITELLVEAGNGLAETVDERALRLLAMNRWRQQAQTQVAPLRYSNHFRCVRRGAAIVAS